MNIRKQTSWLSALPARTQVWAWMLIIASVAGLAWIVFARMRASGDLRSDEVDVLSGEQGSLAHSYHVDRVNRQPSIMNAGGAPEMVDLLAADPMQGSATTDPRANLMVEVRDESGVLVPEATVELWDDRVDPDESSAEVSLEEAIDKELVLNNLLVSPDLFARAMWSRLAEKRPLDETWGNPLSQMSPDGTGRFTAPHMPGVAFNVTATAAGKLTSGKYQLPPRGLVGVMNSLIKSGSMDSSQGVPQVLVVRPQAALTASVITAAGAPEPQALVTFEVLEVGSSRPREPMPTATDGSGRFTVFCDAPVMLLIRVTAVSGESVRRTAILDSGEHVEATIHLSRERRIAGIVLGPSDSAARSASIEIRLVGAGSRSVSARLDEPFELVTGGDGVWDVVASAPSLIQEAPVRVVAKGERPPPYVVINMIRTTRIAGVVRWSTGEPIEGVTVEANPDPESLGKEYSHFLGMTGTTTISSADGRFVLDGVHPSLPYRIRCLSRQSPGTPVTLHNIPPGLTDVEVVFPRALEGGLILWGFVTDASTGNPIERYTIQHGSWATRLTDGQARLIQHQEGKFQIEGASGAWAQGLRIESDGYATKTIGPFVPQPGDGPLEIGLGRLASLRVKAVSPSGVAVEGASVSLAGWFSESSRNRFGRRECAVSGESGMAMFESLEPGEYEVFVRHAVGQSDVVPVTVASGSAAKVDVVVRDDLQTGRMLVSMLSREGRGIADAEVVVRKVDDATCQYADERGDSACVAEKTGVTGGDGTVLIDGLCAGYYWVFVSPGSVFVSPQDAIVRAGGVTSVRCTIGD